MSTQVTISKAKKRPSQPIPPALTDKENIVAKGKQRRIGGAADVILSISTDFDAPLDEFAEYMS